MRHFRPHNVKLLLLFFKLKQQLVKFQKTNTTDPNIRWQLKQHRHSSTCWRWLLNELTWQHCYIRHFHKCCCLQVLPYISWVIYYFRSLFILYARKTNNFNKYTTIWKLGWTSLKHCILLLHCLTWVGLNVTKYLLCKSQTHGNFDPWSCFIASLTYLLKP